MSNYVKAVLCVLASYLTISVNNIFVQLTSVDAFGDIFWRNLFCCLILLPIMLQREGTKSLHLEKELRMPLLGRCIAGFGSMSLLFVSVGMVSDDNFATVQFIFNSNPLLTVILAMLFLKEKVRPLQYVAIGAAIVGVMLILNPSAAAFEMSLIVALAAAVATSAAAIFMRQLKTAISPLGLVFYFCLFCTLVSAVVQLFMGWQNPNSLLDFGYVLICGVQGVLIILFMTLAYRFGDASKVGVYAYSSFIFGLLTQIFYKGTMPSSMVMIGASIIFAAGIFNYFVTKSDAKAAEQAEKQAINAVGVKA